MLRRPDVDEVMEYGRALGFDLTPMEARMIQARMMDTIAALETFDEMRVEERRPPLRFTDATRAAAPPPPRIRSAPSSPRCRVPGATSGPLHGKTVALKDHIALAGVPHDVQLAHDGRLRAGLRRHRGHAAARGGRHHHRQAQDGGVLWGGPGCPGRTTAARRTRTTASTVASKSGIVPSIMCELNVMGTAASAMWSLSATVWWSGPLVAPGTRQRVMKAPSGSSAAGGGGPGRGRGSGAAGAAPPPASRRRSRARRWGRSCAPGSCAPPSGSGRIPGRGRTPSPRRRRVSSAWLHPPIGIGRCDCMMPWTIVGRARGVSCGRGRSGERWSP